MLYGSKGMWLSLAACLALLLGCATGRSEPSLCPPPLIPPDAVLDAWGDYSGGTEKGEFVKAFFRQQCRLAICLKVKLAGCE